LYCFVDILYRGMLLINTFSMIYVFEHFLHVILFSFI